MKIKSFMQITFDWITDNCTKAGGYKRIQVEAIGISWPLSSGWKNRSVGQEISEAQQKIFESFAGPKGRNRIIGKDFKLTGDCAECCEPWEICSWPCPDAI